MKTYLCITFYCIICSLHVVGQHKNYTEAYNLTFKYQVDTTAALYPWVENAKYQHSSVLGMVTDTIHMSKLYAKGWLGSDRLQSEWSQRILLPECQEKKCQVYIDSKGRQCSLSLIVSALNKDEIPVSSDTVLYNPNYTSITSSPIAQVKIDGTPLLDIKIYAEGPKQDNAYIALYSLHIRLGERDIDAFPIRRLNDIPIDRSMEIMALDSNLMRLQAINEIQTAKIIGLGESVHENEDVQRLACQFILQQVKQGKCKLILMEHPFENLLAYNHYIHQTDFNWSNNYNNRGEVKQQLLDQLREYNIGKDKTRQVSVAGIDYRSSSIRNTAVDLFDYLIEVNRYLKSRVIDGLALALMEKDWQYCIQYIQQHKAQLDSILVFGESESMVHILSLSGNMGKDYIHRFGQRDSIFYINAQFAINQHRQLTNQQENGVIVYGHALHINQFSTYPVVLCKPLGAYMKAFYGEKYTPLLILIGQGMIGALGKGMNSVYQKMSNPPVGSIEHVLSALGKDLLYMPITNRFDSIVYTRISGSAHAPRQFFPMNLWLRYKGLLYAKGNPTSMLPLKEISISDKMKQAADKMKERGNEIVKIYERIKQQ